MGIHKITGKPNKDYSKDNTNNIENNLSNDNKIFSIQIWLIVHLNIVLI